MKKISPKQRDLIFCAILIVSLFSGLVVDNKFYLDILITSTYYSIIAVAWNIMCGYTGQLSLGHGAFLGIGQYTSVLLYTKLGLTPWLGVFAGGVMAMLLAFLIGVLVLRLKGPFFALSTIALCTILQILAVKFTDLTGGASGITIRFDPALVNIIFRSYKIYFTIFVILLLVVLVTTIRVRHSRLGSNLIAIRENDLAASSLGINLFKNQVIALIISAFFTSVAGCFYAQYVLFIYPEGAFDIIISQKAAILSIVGGAGTVFGPAIGGFVLTPTEIMLRTWLGSTYQGAYLIVYGVLLIFVILVIPNGVIGTIAQYFLHRRSLRVEKLS
ncbi:MAG: branched-chain amino acid ABC transporter permease [Synergistaceae bacterium]|jgi:branched-chain amino acid transport system permease protein|nr:branched-chain amino acid ABC transporter permease [Synergistaceae bacterium]